MVKDSSSHHASADKFVTRDLFYGSLFKYNPDMVIFMDVHGIVVKVNKGFCELLGYRPKEVELKSFEKILPPYVIEKYQALFKEVLTGKTNYTYTNVLAKNGDVVVISLDLLPAVSKGKVIGVFGIAKDLSMVKKYEAELAESELKFKSITEESFVGIYILREDGTVAYGNKKFFEIIGMTDTEAELNFRDYVHPEDLSTLKSLSETLINGDSGMTHTYRIVKQDGTVRDVEANSTKIYLRNEPHVTGTFQDITERKKQAELNEYLAYHDYLTELPNRRFFKKKLEEQLTISNTLEEPFAVMSLDLDRFKYVNDSLGHSIGDKLLQKVAKRLKESLHEHDFLARDGGDEFIILVPNTRHPNKVVDYATRIIKSLEAPFYIDHYELFITASIGVSSFPLDGDDAETLLKHADSALYKAKTKGKNTYQIFTTSMNTEAFKIFSLETDLRKAIELNQLELYYQPQISTIDHAIVGAEALIRWNHPEWGLVYPNEFLPIAEETGLIRDIGKWLKKTACRQNKAWQDAGLPAIPVSINLSAHRFLEKNLIENIRATLAETKLEPQYFQVEVVENFLLKNERGVVNSLDELKKMGINVLLDDFGTGYSSLSYLQKFRGKLQTLKIDRTFISDISRSDEGNSTFMTKTIIDIARNLQMGVIAEGVETREQLEILQEANCHTVQGYLFSRPVPAGEFATMLYEGKIEPQDESEKSTFTEERRKSSRIDFDIPLGASMTLTEIHGREVKIGRTEVLVENIGLDGLRFLSDIRLPVQHALRLEFKTKILGEIVILHGTIIWMEELKPGLFQYGIEFSFKDEHEQTNLVGLLDRLAIFIRKNPHVPDSEFLDVDRYAFFADGRM